MYDIILFVQEVSTFLGAKPYLIVVVFVDTKYQIIINNTRSVHVWAKYANIVSVIPTKTVNGSIPDVSLVILKDTMNGIDGQLIDGADIMNRYLLSGSRNSYVAD